MKGYSQSNRGRWHMIGWPATPDRWWWLGTAGAVAPWTVRPELIGAPHYMAMVLRFRCFLFLWNRWSARNSPIGYSTGGGYRSRRCGNKVQASTFIDGEGMLQGSVHDRVGPNGCGVERRTLASFRWSSWSIACGVAMKKVNLGFISVFFKIPAQLSSIYRGLGLISCACRLYLQALKFDWDSIFHSISLRFGLATLRLGDNSMLGRQRPALGQS
jgi:hypothetical protein